jgi:glycosyltransferase involved in cell wall biosynthesis
MELTDRSGIKTVNSPLISVIMPAYNAERFIVQAIQSVLDQEYPHWELIVVDDGSTDETAAVVGSFEDSRIRYTFQENKGQAAALNRGLDLARGEFITTLDADDRFTTNSLGDRALFLHQHPDFGVVYGDGLYCDEVGNEFLRFTDHMPSGNSGDVYDLLIVSPFYGTGASVMERKDALTRHGIRYDESIVWCQDWDFYIRLAEVVPFGFVESATIRYRIHNASMTESIQKGRKYDSLIRLREKVLNSERFRRANNRQKSAFFYDFVVKDLHGEPSKQGEVFECTPFKSLAPKEQARLMRLAANRYFLDKEQVDIAKKWLRSSWLSAPFEPKTILLLLSSFISLNITRKIIQTRQNQIQGEEQESPFKMVKSLS